MPTFTEVQAVNDAVEVAIQKVREAYPSADNEKILETIRMYADFQLRSDD